MGLTRDHIYPTNLFQENIKYQYFGGFCYNDEYVHVFEIPFPLNLVFD